MAKFGLFGSGSYGIKEEAHNPVLLEYEGESMDNVTQDLIVIYDARNNKQAVIKLAPGQSVKKMG
ncbi:MAG TPA: hypothetical protein VNZ03_20580 [Terriglobales bacterium]|jgi:hypothetical protein|nr:hypothetical protein [Terriglobales bacterium]